MASFMLSSNDCPEAFSLFACAPQPLSKTSSDDVGVPADELMRMQLKVADSTTGLSDIHAKQLTDSREILGPALIHGPRLSVRKHGRRDGAGVWFLVAINNHHVTILGRISLAVRWDDVSWDQVVDYWTKGGKDPMHIWEMLEAQFSPTEKDAADAVIAVQTLLKAMVPHPHTPSHTTCLPTDHEPHPCRPNCNRVVRLSPEEAIYIVYLGSLPKDRREEIVYSTDAAANEVATDESRQQFLVEANLVRYAIDNSDEMVEDTDRMGHHQGMSDDVINLGR